MKRTNNNQPGAKNSNAELTQPERYTIPVDAVKSGNAAHEFCENCINPDRIGCGMSNPLNVMS